MKKFIFTESQIKKIISNEINEQDQSQTLCVESLLKNAIVDGKNSEIGKILSNGKFKVTDIVGNVNLNGKPYNRESVQKGIILTPNTKVNICAGSSIIMSGMGLKECGLVHDPNGVKFLPNLT
jgi:hypothetical protein